MPGTQLQQPGPDTGSSCGLTSKEILLPPGAHFAHLARLLMSGNGNFSHLTVAQATWVLLASSLKSQNNF